MKYVKEKLKLDISQFIFLIIGLIIGISCIVFPKKIYEYTTYIIGGFMLASAIGMLIHSIKYKEYEKIETKRTATSIVQIILSIVILTNQMQSIYFIAVVWGITGLRKGINGLNIAMYNKSINEKYKLELLHSIVETVLSIMLILDPYRKMEEHIMILGLEILVMMLKHLFKDDKYNENKETI